MTIFIGADHRGLKLKNIIVEYLQNKNIRIEDLGAYEYNKDDDFPDFAKPVAEAVLSQPEKLLGIVICGSAVGVSIAANRYKGVYCGVGFDSEQIKSAKAHDHINILAIPADYLTTEKALELVDVFINTKPMHEEKYIRRLNKI